MVEVIITTSTFLIEKNQVRKLLPCTILFFIVKRSESNFVKGHETCLIFQLNLCEMLFPNVVLKEKYQGSFFHCLTNLIKHSELSYFWMDFIEKDTFC